VKDDLAAVKRVVIKLGTGVLTSGVGSLNHERVRAVADEVAALRLRGIEVLLVSSGAVGLGMGLLGLRRRPKDLPTLQACAAMGQSILINTWQEALSPHGIPVAQVLLTREDLRARQRHNAVLRTLERLIACKALPVINENDTVSAAEIRFGDNDTLSAMVSSVARAQLLFILSTIEGLLDFSKGGQRVAIVKSITPEIEAMASGTRSVTAVGGMVSKLTAARIAMRAGCAVVIASGSDPAIVSRILDGADEGTFFAPKSDPIRSKKRWLAIQDRTFGTLHVDAGAVVALREGGKSLLAHGVTRIEGTFASGELIQIAAPDGKIFALGIADRKAEEIPSCCKKMLDTTRSKQACIVHRDNLVLMD
jgi:glutamate 5-kinase